MTTRSMLLAVALAVILGPALPAAAERSFVEVCINEGIPDVEIQACNQVIATWPNAKQK